ncbi:class I tRNA ligase family protein [Agromyces protaetiae]|uniref:class I tRNA ligase family protein n=1 Tax=Agromyces protaetiae TaxID=2509455 RepID=UPI001FB65AC0|nr:class I tRNA ligase family protein [Agromyces protaetiae]
MLSRYTEGAVPAAHEASVTDADLAIREVEQRATDASWSAAGRLAIHEAIAAVWELVDALNLYITNEEPWTLAKDPAKRERLDTVLATAYHGLGTLAVLLSPVLPKATAKLWSALGGAGNVREQRIDRANEWAVGERVTPLEALFPRVEVTE